jgi:hypothetical protein
MAVVPGLQKALFSRQQHMRFQLILMLSLCLPIVGDAQKINLRSGAANADAFWTRFQASVAADDIAAVASMTKYPLLMPYGVRKIASRAQLLKRYKTIFDRETKQCFANARPEMDTAKKDRFSISCGEAMMYWFEADKGQYKFVTVDNVNE